MNLSTRYLGLELPHPLIPGASPLSDTIDSVRRLEDAGAPAIVLRSLFEEQIEREQMVALEAETHEQSFAEALTYFPTPQTFVFGPDEYLEHLRRVKVAVAVPVIASLNGATPGGWLEYAQLMEKAHRCGLHIGAIVKTAPSRQGWRRFDPPGKPKAYFSQESTRAPLSATHFLAKAAGSILSTTMALVKAETNDVSSLTLDNSAAAVGCDFSRAVA